MSYRSHAQNVFLRAPLLIAIVAACFAVPLAGRVTAAPETPTTHEGAAISLNPLAGSAALVSVQADGASSVRYFLNPDPQAWESSFAGIAAAASSVGTQPASLDTSGLPNGVHTLVSVIDYPYGRREIKSERFVVYNGPDALLFGPEPLSFSVPHGGRIEREVEVLASGSPAAYRLTSDSSWLRFKPATPTGAADAGVAPGRHVAEIDATSLTPGVHTATVTATGEGVVPARSVVTVEVLAPAADCAPLDCSQVRVQVPYVLNFDQDHGGLKDRNGVGTGFTWVQKPTGAGGTGYIPANLLMDLAAGELQITTNGGIAHLNNNNQDNMLGVGIAAANQISVLDTVLVDIPAPTGNFEQAGLWYGVDQDNYVKVVLVAEADAVRVQFVEERAGAIQQQVVSGPISNVTNSTVHLRLRANPEGGRVTGYYGLNEGGLTELSTFTVPGLLFNADGAGLDPTLGTRVFGGIHATDRFYQGTLNYRFDYFSLTTGGNPSQPGTFGFDRKSSPANYPSSIVYAPDGRLYFTETFGPVRALRYDANWNVVSNDLIYTFQGRLVLGITVDPASTAQNVILWVAHSSGNFSGGMYAGEVNSGMVSKLTGPGWTREDMITGLPRALANHSTNSLHFGPDGRLYIAQGGNTGAGAPNEIADEFGNRPEQPLSAALLVADVKKAGFDGSCATDLGSFGPAPCDVTTYATGMRNMYDFVFHSNGQLYGPDNGLGVDGSFPPLPVPVCTGQGNPAPWDQGGQNPGTQPDLLLRIEQGKYYGHPNPYRNECVFKNGSFQGVQPLPNYMAPLLDLGMSRSANGIREYKSDAFGGQLKGNLLITNYSQGDNITRVVLAPDGMSVALAESLVGGFVDPLPIHEGPNGVLFVGEHGAAGGIGKITVLIPRATGSWTTKAPLPVKLVDAGSAVLNGKLYLVAGKDETGPKRTLHIYDATTDGWTLGAPLPQVYPAVENPAVAAYNNKLYVFGGSTDWASGAVANAAVYDPATNGWAELAAMPTARGGATAQVLGNLIYVVGGMNASGASVPTVEVYNPANNAWSTGTPMQTARDNPGSAVVGSKLYVFGGRTRYSAGGEEQATPTTVEIFDPATNAWTFGAPMPTGRRVPVVGVLNGAVYVIGGENNNGVFGTVEKYDPVTNSWQSGLSPMPTARHGAGGGTIGNAIYVAGGSTASGVVAVNVNEVFSIGEDAPPPVNYPYKLYMPMIRK